MVNDGDSTRASVRNQFRGINPHLHSLWQADGRWSGFHTVQIAQLLMALKAALRPLGYTAAVEDAEARRGTHDLVHGFRSAAVAGRALAQIGFPTALWYNALIETWFALTDTATIIHALEALADHWNQHPPPFVWSGKRRERRRTATLPTYSLPASGAAAVRSLRAFYATLRPT